jgi:hypothetical protein
MFGWYKFFLCLTAFVVLIIMGKCTGDALGHEIDGFNHTKKGETTGPCIGSRSCNGGFSVWTIDDNHDGIADRCIDLIFTHGEYHVRHVVDAVIENNICQCTKEVE